MASKRKKLHETDDEFSDAEIESESKSASVNKSAKRKQPYREKYTEKYPCIKRGSDEYKVFCTICASEFGCMYGGMDDVLFYRACYYFIAHSILSRSRTLIVCVFSFNTTSCQ